MKVFYTHLQIDDDSKLAIYRDLPVAGDYPLPQQNSPNPPDITDFVMGFLTFHKLTHLTIFGNFKIDFNIERFVCLLKITRTLDCLEIQYNDLTNQDAESIAGILQINNSLTTLSLEGNLIGSKGLCKISGGLEFNSSLRSLDLSFNSISNNGVKRFAEVLKSNSTIETVNMIANKITLKGIKSIANMLKVNETIKTLLLGFNYIGDIGAKYIAEGLKFNKCLTELDVRCSEISPAGDGVKALKESLYLNFKLSNFNLYLPSEKADWSNHYVKNIELYVEQNLSLAGESSDSEEDLYSKRKTPCVSLGM